MVTNDKQTNEQKTKLIDIILGVAISEMLKAIVQLIQLYLNKL